MCIWMPGKQSDSDISHNPSSQRLPSPPVDCVCERDNPKGMNAVYPIQCQCCLVPPGSGVSQGEEIIPGHHLLPEQANYFPGLCPAFQEAGKGQETIYIPIGKLLNLLKSWLCWQLTGDNVGPNGCSSRPAERWVRLQETDKRKVHQGNSSLKKIYFLIFFY